MLFGRRRQISTKYRRDFDVPEKSDLFVDGVDASSSMQMLPPASAKEQDLPRTTARDLLRTNVSSSQDQRIRPSRAAAR